MTCNTDASGLPPERFITDPAKLDHYSRDATPGISCRPEAVCLPKTVAEVESVLKWAFSEKIPVTCRGAGTGNSGGAIPVQKGLVLSLEKLNRILEVDVDNRVARVEPGVITEHLQNRVLEEGLFYPPDPASLSVCTIGGNVAENAGGPRAVKYGVTKDYVIGLAGFFVNGEPFKFGGKQYKNVAGYDLIRLLVGSEGTLGVITEVTVRLLSNPPVTQDLIVGFPDYQTALRGMRTVLTSSITPAVVEFMDAYCVTVTARYLEIPVPVKSASVYLLFQQDGSSVGNVLDQIEKIRSLCDSSGAIFSRVLEGETCQSVWRVRREISRALKDLSPNKIAQDVVVPPAEIPDFMSYLKALG
ncbi:MAG: glycolate oxidase, partial [Candidatus Marinamargulisbacteria bacterium]